MFKYLLIISSLCLFLLNPLFAETTPKTWTFLVFLNGDNNLDPYGAENIRAMEQVGSNDHVNIVVQWASESAGKTVRLLVKKSTNPNVVTSPILQDMGQVDMGDYHSLQDFIQWGVQNFPADHYFVNVWNHGSGWHSRNVKRNKTSHLFGDISWDDITGHSITTEQLGQVMKYAARLIGHKVDLYASDACLMAMAEVANEMSKSVNVFAGSQETEPGAGWSYQDLLSRWLEIPNATPAQVAKILAETYVKSYEGGVNGYSDVTFSAFDLSKLAAFDQAMNDFSSNIKSLNSSTRNKLIRTVNSTQHFAFPDYVDLLDFTKKLTKANIPGIKSDVISNLQNATQDLIIANETTSGYVNATGLSIWLPTDESYAWYIDRYKALSFNADTHWGDALDFLNSRE